MTLEQELELQNLLKQWREERHLTIESQRDGLMGNLCEEMAEYYRAINDDEKIDALCDIYVFCMNSFDEDLKVAIDDFDRTLISEIYITQRFKLRLVSEIELKLIELKAKDIIVDTFNLYLYVFMRCVENEALRLGYNFYECMLETIKEISSRTGYYNEDMHKFVKDKSDEAVKNWYKADYSKCKI